MHLALQSGGGSPARQRLHYNVARWNVHEADRSHYAKAMALTSSMGFRFRRRISMDGSLLHRAAEHWDATRRQHRAGAHERRITRAALGRARGARGCRDRDLSIAAASRTSPAPAGFFFGTLRDGARTLQSRQHRSPWRVLHLQVVGASADPVRAATACMDALRSPEDMARDVPASRLRSMGARAGQR